MFIFLKKKNNQIGKEAKAILKSIFDLLILKRFPNKKKSRIGVSNLQTPFSPFYGFLLRFTCNGLKTRKFSLKNKNTLKSLLEGFKP